MRVYTIGRLDEISDVDSKERHLTIIKEMLLDGKYKKLAYGQVMLIELYRLLNDQAEQRDDGQRCIELQN